MNDKAKIHPSAYIHPSVILEGEIEIGSDTIIGSGSYLKGPLIIGNGNRIGHNVMLGVDPEHKTKPADGVVTIGDGNVIREFSVVQRGIGDADTQIQNSCYIMAYTYIAHDCIVESDAILCARVSLAGHCCVLKGAVLGMASSVHQFSTIGAHALVGMGSVVVKDVPPFCVAMGNPACFSKFNDHAFVQLGIKPQELSMNGSLLHSGHPYIGECLKAFDASTRRGVISIESVIARKSASA